MVSVHGVEGISACEVVEAPEDAGAGLYLAVLPGDHQRGVGCFQDAHLEEHLEAQVEDHLVVPLEVPKEDHLEDWIEGHLAVPLEARLPGYPCVPSDC